MLGKKSYYLLSALVASFSLFWTLPLYFLSSFIAQFLEKSAVSLFFLLVSFVACIAIIIDSRTLAKIGNTKTSIILYTLGAACAFTLSFMHSHVESIGILLIYLVTIEVLLLSNEITTELLSSHHSIGKERGYLLTIQSICFAVSPLLSGFLVSLYGFSLVFFVTGIIALPALVICFYYKNTLKEPHYKPIRSLKEVFIDLHDTNVRTILFSNFLLHTFYASMVIFIPLHLSKIGFTISHIGSIISFALLAFIFTQYPLGIYADKHGEKKVLIIGNSIMIASLFAIATLSSTSIIVWMIILFISRVGASMIETMNSIYIFKTTNKSRLDIIELFRITKPLAYCCVSAIAILALEGSGSYTYIFIFVAILCFINIKNIVTLKEVV